MTFAAVVSVLGVATFICFGKLGLLGKRLGKRLGHNRIGWLDVRSEHVTDSMLISRAWPLLFGPLWVQLGPRHGINADITWGAALVWGSSSPCLQLAGPILTLRRSCRPPRTTIGP